MSKLKNLFWAVLISLLTLIFLVVFMLTTPGGLRLTFRLIETQLPGELALKELKHTLWRGFTIGKVIYTVDHKHVVLQNLQLHWHPMRFFLGKQPAIVSIQHGQWGEQVEGENLKIVMKNTPTQWRLNGKIKTLFLKRPRHATMIFLHTQLAAKKNHSLPQIALDNLHTNINETGKLDLQGLLNWKTGQHWKMKLNAQNINPVFYWPNTQGNLHFSIEAEKSLTHTSVLLKKLSGQLNHHPIEGALTLEKTRGGFSLPKLHLKLGDNLLKAKGFLGKTWQLNWQLLAPHTQQIFAHSRGKIEWTGQVRGARHAPHLTSQLVSENISWLRNNAVDGWKNLSLTANVNLAPHQPVSVLLRGSDLHYQGQTLQTLQLKLQGSSEKHQLTLDAHNKHHFHLGLTGNFEDKTWQATIKKSWLDFFGRQRWTLKKPSHLSLSRKQFTLTPFCLSAEKHGLCAQGKWLRQKLWQFSLNGTKVPLDRLSQWLPAKTQISTQADLHFAATGHPAKAEWALHLSPGYLAYEAHSTPHRLPLLAGQFSGELNEKKGLHSVLNLSFEKNQRLNFQGTLPDWHSLKQSFFDQKVQANARVQLQQLALLPIVFPEAHDTEGTLKLFMQMNGSVSKPKLTGKATLEMPTLHLPRLGITLKSVSATGHSLEPGHLLFSANAHSGEGALKITGDTHLQQPGAPSKIMIEGENVLVSNTPEYQLTATPQLQVKTQHHQMSIQGNIVIPKGKVIPLRFNTTAITLPSDVVLTDHHRAINKKSWQINSDITLRLGDKIHLDLMGLTGLVGGELQLHDEPNKLSTAKGELRISNGKYRAYGQSLTVTNGRLSFTGGPLDNPGIQLKAIKHITQNNFSNNNLGPQLQSIRQINKTQIRLPGQGKDLLVGIQINGTLSEPKIRLFSEPATLNQSDTLAYLILGRPFRDVSQNNVQLLSRVATSLSLGKSSDANLQQQLEKNLHLDEIELETNKVPTTLGETPSLDDASQSPTALTENTSLVLGKALSPRLYVHYSIGLLQPINVFKLRYLISSRWALQSETSALGNGVDLFYTLEQ